MERSLAAGTAAHCRSQIGAKPAMNVVSVGAARGIRTPDPVITNDVLYQLSYCGEPESVRLTAGLDHVAT